MKRITHVDGVEVVEQRPAYGTHPKYRDRQVLISGVSHLLLDDGTEKFSCDLDGKVMESVQSVVAHMGSHNRQHAPTYPVDVIKHVLRAVKRNSGARNKCELAALELNAAGITTNTNQPWLAQNVSYIYNKYKNMYNVRVQTRRAVTPPAPAQRKKATRTPAIAKSATVESTLRFSQENVESIVNRLADFGDRLHALTTEYETLMGDVVLSLRHSRHTDLEMLEKAARWDQAQSLFSGK